MKREWAITVTAESNHLRVDLTGQERIGATWVLCTDLPTIDLICDPEEDGGQLLKAALVHVIEHL